MKIEQKVVGNALWTAVAIVVEYECTLLHGSFQLACCLGVGVALGFAYYAIGIGVYATYHKALVC